MNHKFSIKQVCDFFGKTRQAFYQAQKYEQTNMFIEDFVMQLVKEKRRKLPKSGGRKMYNLLKNDLKNLDKSVGRDKFFDILRKNQLLIHRKKRFVKTTNANHLFKKYKNLIKGLDVSRANQVFVSDITYIRTCNGFLYLALVSDLYSRKILGYDLSNSLSIEGSMRAIKMATKNLKITKELIHHSDRGIQYCCHEYVSFLAEKKINISMTEENHCYENAVAERINGILKEEFMLNYTFRSHIRAKQAVTEAVKNYNELRPHTSLGYLTPAQKYAA